MCVCALKNISNIGIPKERDHVSIYWLRSSAWQDTLAQLGYRCYGHVGTRNTFWVNLNMFLFWHSILNHCCFIKMCYHSTSSYSQKGVPNTQTVLPSNFQTIRELFNWTATRSSSPLLIAIDIMYPDVVLQTVQSSHLLVNKWFEKYLIL